MQYELIGLLDFAVIVVFATISFLSIKSFLDPVLDDRKFHLIVGIVAMTINVAAFAFAILMGNGLTKATVTTKEYDLVSVVREDVYGIVPAVHVVYIDSDKNEHAAVLKNIVDIDVEDIPEDTDGCVLYEEKREWWFVYDYKLYITPQKKEAN